MASNFFSRTIALSFLLVKQQNGRDDDGLTLTAKAGRTEMDDFKRYAVYFTPPPSALAVFGASWLGWDVASGREVEQISAAELPKPIDQITKQPRPYGFHATLRPPIALPFGIQGADFIDATRQLAKDLSPISKVELSLSKIGSFFALTAPNNAKELSFLSSVLVMGLNCHRRELSREQYAKRSVGKSLNREQKHNLERYGYPYVLREFRFHMTLTGPIKEDDQAATRTVLQTLTANITSTATSINDVSIVGEDADGNFHEVERIALGAR